MGSPRGNVPWAGFGAEPQYKSVGDTNKLWLVLTAQFLTRGIFLSAPAENGPSPTVSAPYRDTLSGRAFAEPVSRTVWKQLRKRRFSAGYAPKKPVFSL